MGLESRRTGVDETSSARNARTCRSKQTHKQTIYNEMPHRAPHAGESPDPANTHTHGRAHARTHARALTGRSHPPARTNQA